MLFAGIYIPNHIFVIALLLYGWPCTLSVSVFFLAYLVSLHRLLSRLRAANRTLSTAEVWLLLTPIFNLLWYFRVLLAFDKAIFAELRDRDQLHGYDAVGMIIPIGLFIWLAATGMLVVFGIFTTRCDAEEAVYIYLFLQVPAYGIAAFLHMFYIANVTILLNQSEPTA